MARDSLVKGTIILALAAFTARFLGVVQRVPLEYILGKDGSGLFGAANQMYLMLLTVATAGIPSALSKLVAERTELGRHREAYRIFRASVKFAMVAGAVITVGLLVGAPLIAAVSETPDAVYAYQAIAPTLLIFPLVAMMRGYMQGLGMMTPGGMSQIWEQILRVVTSLLLAGALVALGASIPAAAAGASFGSVLGGVAAFAVMVYYFRKINREQRRTVPSNAPFDPEVPGERQPGDRLRSDWQIYRMIFRISLPITLFSLAVPLVYTVDIMLWNPLLIPQLGEHTSREWLGILTTRAQSVAGLPIILAVALSQSVVPVISAAYARRDEAEVARQTSLCLRLALLSGLPAVIVLTAAARPVTGFLFKDAEGYGLVALLTAGTVFQILMMTSGAILMGLGKTNNAVVYVKAGAVVKLIATLAFARWIGPYGFALATGLCFAVAAALNLAYLRKLVSYRVFGWRWTGVLATAAVTGAAGYGLERLFDGWLAGTNKFVHYGATGAIAAGAMAVLYPLLLAATRVVTKADVASFPTPVRRLIGRFVRIPAPGAGRS